MPRLPAVCTECEIVYPSPLRAERPDGDNAFAVPVPCPACGSGGRVPAEVLRRLTETVDVLRGLGTGPDELAADLEEIAAVCREVDGREEAVLEVLRRVPRAGRLAGLLPGETPSQMAVFTRVVRELARETAEQPPDDAAEAEAPSADAEGGPSEGAGAADGPEDGPEPAMEIVDRALAVLYERAAPEASEPPDEEERARRRLRDNGRNDPCPCGSGEKYKACHWVEDQRTTRV